jgi:hypothetical protein
MLTDTTLADRVAALGDRTGARVVDLLQPFRAHRGAHLYYTVDEHWNAAGQALAAARVARAVSARIGGGS